MANIITISRFPLLFIYLFILYYGGQNLQYWNVALIFIIFQFDSLDGWVARKLGETSLFGSVLDIATDRTLEYTLWIVYAHLGLISILVPLIVIIRGTSVDAIRSVGMRSGDRAFDQITTPLNRFLVSSRFMRAFYGAVKAIAAILLTLVAALQTVQSNWYQLIYQTALIFTWISVITCVIRGIPVMIEGARKLQVNQ